MVKCPATCSDLSNRVYKPFWLIQLGNTMEDIDESEARRRHTVSANAKGEKEVPFRSTPITTRGAQSGPLLKRVQISSNDLAKIKESANYEDGEGMRDRGVTWSESSARKPRRRERPRLVRSAGFLLRVMGDMFDRITGRQRTRSVSKSKRTTGLPPD